MAITIRQANVENKELFALMVDTVNGTVIQKDPEGANDADDAIRKAIFKDILGIEDHTDRRFAGRASLKCAEIFQYIVENIQEVYSSPFINDPFFQRFVEYKSVDWGDRLAFRVEDQYFFTVSEYSGNHWDTRRQRNFGSREIPVSCKWFNVYIYSEYWDFLVGKIDWVTLVKKVQLSIDMHLMGQINANFMNAPNILPTEFKKYTTGIVKAEMIELAERVRTMTGAAPVICGTKQGLSLLGDSINVNWISERMRDRVYTTGLLESWEGYELFPIPNAFKSGTYDFVDMDFLMLIPSNVGAFLKVCDEGGQITRATDTPQANQDWTIDYNVAFKRAVLLVMGAVYGAYYFV